MTTSEVRKKFLDFMAAKGHVTVPSALLVPENDPTTLFTGSGMQPILPFLLGAKHPQGTKIADSQKCFRSQDIEEVGDNRHTTFFEMLGNWSLGDFFKQEQIPWMWEFLTNEIGLSPKNIYFTCFKGDDALNIPKDTESAELWQKLFASVGVTALIGENPERDGMQPGERIFYYNAKKNWWSRAGVPANMPVGEPGGPDTEMFWDFEPEIQKLHQNSVWKNQPCHVNCDCGRFMEIGNNVFMEYKKTEQGFEKLAQQNVDFGGGLERIAAAKNNVADIFALDIFNLPIIELEARSKKKYGEDTKTTYAMRVVLDHLRAATFLVGDGVLPGNKDQGYFVRRLIRRAVRFARDLGINDNFTDFVVGQMITVYMDQYPNLFEQKSFVINEILKEEEKFRKTLEKGLKEFQKIQGTTIDAETVFQLATTYGFPIELTEELAKEKGITIDMEAVRNKMKAHQDLSRSGSEQKFKGGLADHSEMSVKYHTATHLLHKALKTILGEHVQQKGSNITPERLRFDFTHSEKMTEEQKKKVETLVNEQIQKALPVTFEDLPLAEAEKRGAIGLFEEKYGDVVRVYKIGDFSLEFCGGPHVENTSTLGTFSIQKEEAVSQGVRRIKAILS